jgi:hypothetical protein
VDSKQAIFKGLFDGETDTVRFAEASSFLSRVKKLIDPSAIAVVSARGGQAEAEADRGEADLDVDIDDEVNDPLEEMIDAADETDDSPLPAPEPEAVADNDGRGEAVPSEPMPAPEPAHTMLHGTNGTAHPAAPGRVRDLFAQLQVRREPTSGKVVIEAPAEAAGELGALFEGMAALLQSIARS